MAQTNQQDLLTEQPKPSGEAAPVAQAAIEPVREETGSDEPSRAISAFSDEKAFTSAQRMAKAICTSSLVPKEYQGNIQNTLIAMELAHRIGASVLMVMQSLDIVHGRPSWRSTFLIATVNASGHFTPIRFRWSGEEGKDSWGCRAVAKDKGSGEECLGALITIALAKAEGWYGKNGSKWKTIPEQMLMYRAAAFWTRVYSPELSLGMHTNDELVDTYGEEVADRALPFATGSTSNLESALRAEAATERQTGEEG
jgi:hypothetical protein